MTRAYFITGTDTEIGKTYVACALLHAFRQQGLTAVGMKPVAAGIDVAGHNEDVEALIAASSYRRRARTGQSLLLCRPDRAAHCRGGGRRDH